MLLGIPLVAFVVPALAGYPAIAGDNLIQNFPLRALSGELIRQGHLPLWNPLIWSGSPLLGGLNAGSLYPFTLFFVFLPAVAAWVVGMIGVYWISGLGTYALLRRLRLGPLPSLLGAATYAFGGQMASQMVHLGIVQGLAWLPLMVLAQFELSWALFGTRPAKRGSAAAPDGAAPVPRRSPWPPTVLLAVVIGLVLLTGEPRGMAEAEVVASVVTLWLLLRSYGRSGPSVGRRLQFLGFSLLAAVWAAALGAVQLLPGWHFISTSQRSSESFSFFASGSLHVQWSVLLLVPDLFGGDGLLHQPSYFNSYNLAEVTGYVGLLPLVAFFALLTRAFGRRHDPQAKEWWLWIGLTVLGLLMAFGSYTPLGGLFGMIPFFNKVRLQSRNLAIADLALAVLFAYWLERALQGREAAALAGPGWRRRVALVPLAMAGAASVVALAVPGRLESAFSFNGGNTTLGRYLTPSLAVQLGVVAVMAALVLGWGRLGTRARRRALCAAVALDLGLFTAACSTGLIPGNVSLEPTPTEAAAAVGTTGRFAIYDTTAINTDSLSKLGQPDLNAFTGLPSVQGYGSIVGAAYTDATGTHTLDTLSPCALATGVFDQVRLSTLLVLPEFLAQPLAPGATLPAPVQQFPSTAQSVAPDNCAGAPRPGTPTTRRWYFGQTLTLTGVQLVPGAPGARHRLSLQGLRVGVVTPSGAVRFPAARLLAVSGGGVSVVFRRPPSGIGLVVDSTARQARSISDGSEITVAPSSEHPTGALFGLNGQLQNVTDIGAWRYDGVVDGYARFTAIRLRPPVWVSSPVSGDRARQVRTVDDGTAVVEVQLRRPAVVVRSEAYMAGWRVTAVPAGGGPSRTLSVFTDGLVQGVRVPAGRWTLTYRYHPPGLTPGLAGTGAGLVALVAAAVLGLATRRRRRRDRRSAPPEGRDRSGEASVPTMAGAAARGSPPAEGSDR